MTPSLKSYTGEKKDDPQTAVVTIAPSAAIAAAIAKAATAAEKKDDPQAAVVAEAASAVGASTTASAVTSAASTVPAESVASFASASTVCCTQIAHIESSNNDVYST